MANSLHKNKHPYMQYKYYKMQFYLIPQLKKYQYIIWLDSSFRIKSNNTVEKLVKLISNTSYPIMFYNHPDREYIYDEVEISKTDSRWSSKNLWGIKQPFQNLARQISDYSKAGFNDTSFHKLWATGAFIIDMANIKSKQLLDEWYFQTLKYTTQCQVSLPFAAWKTQCRVGSLYPGNIYENPYFYYIGHEQ